MVDRVFLIVLDSLGVGEMPDAADFGDEGSHTLGNIIKELGSLNIPNLVRLGIGNINGINIPYTDPSPIGNYGKAGEVSKGKDTTTGHWEIAGIQMKDPFPVYPDGFPPEVMNAFHQAINNDSLWNKPASGSEIINKLGDEHVKTGKVIVYTSADSVFQIAAHEDIVPLEDLYRYCELARSILRGKHGVGRVIARPFVGNSGNYVRTKNRKDFSLPPLGPTILDVLAEENIATTGVGKISDIFAGRGLQNSFAAKTNDDAVKVILDLIISDTKGLVFANLIDFDMLYGHRNDVSGYGASLESFDIRIPELLAALTENDVLILTADHGCDPTTPSTDHSREYIPVLVYGKGLRQGVNLGILSSFSDIGATVMDLLGVKLRLNGTSFLSKIKKA